MDNMKKHIEHKETLKMMNEALKRQMDLVKEECELRLKEEMAKRQESQGGFSDTMGELSTLLETQSGQNKQLLTENTELSGHMGALLEEAQKREAQFETVQTELQLQLKLLEAQMKKAQLEKAEIKCEMTQERMEISQELNVERDRSINLERTVTLLREQIDVYEVSHKARAKNSRRQCFDIAFCSCSRNSPMSCPLELVTMPSSSHISRPKLTSSHKTWRRWRRKLLSGEKSQRWAKSTARLADLDPSASCENMFCFSWVTNKSRKWIRWRWRRIRTWHP